MMLQPFEIETSIDVKQEALFVDRCTWEWVRALRIFFDDQWGFGSPTDLVVLVGLSPKIGIASWKW